MNYYAARESRHPDTGASRGWHYTVMNGGVIRAMGYCAGWPDFDRWVRDGIMPKPVIEKELARCKPHKAKYHTHFHHTQQEAEECYQAYLIDHTYRVETIEVPKCAHCGCVTDQVVYLDLFQVGYFCGDHQSIDFLREHYPKRLTVRTVTGS